MSSVAEGVISPQTALLVTTQPAIVMNRALLHPPNLTKSKTNSSPHPVIALSSHSCALRAVICCFSNFLMSAYFMPSTMPNTRDEVEVETKSLKEFTFYWRKHWVDIICSNLKKVITVLKWEIMRVRGLVALFTKGVQKRPIYDWKIREREPDVGRARWWALWAEGRVTEALLWEKGQWDWSIVTPCSGGGRCRTVGTSNEMSSLTSAVAKR